jgi:hypothetical protein
MTFLERFITISVEIFIFIMIPFCLGDWIHLLWSWIPADAVAKYLEGKKS